MANRRQVWRTEERREETGEAVGSSLVAALGQLVFAGSGGWRLQAVSQAPFKQMIMHPSKRYIVLYLAIALTLNT